MRPFLRAHRRWFWLLLLALVPLPVYAHSSVKGLNDFVNGLLHPLTTLPHVLIIVGLGLMAGRPSPLNLKLPLCVFAPLSALALGLSATGWIKEVYPPILIGFALCLGALLALEKTPTMTVTCLLFAAAAIGLGLDSAVETDSAAKKFKTLLGNWLSLNFLVFDLAIYVSLAGQAAWLKIAWRVIGSWIVAIAMLVLAFSFRK